MFSLARVFAVALVVGCVLQAEGAGASHVNLAKRNKADEKGLEDFSKWPRDKVFLKVGQDVVLWGSVYDYIGFFLKTKPLSLPPEATLADFEKAKRFNERKVAMKLAKRYVGGSLMAQVAKKAGVDPHASSMTATGIVAKLVAAFPSEYQAELKATCFTPGSYLSACVTNTLLSDAYVESVVKPGIAVTAAEVTNAVAERIKAIDQIKAINLEKKKRLNDLLADLRAGKVKFEKAAEFLSNCTSSENGGYWGRVGKSSSLLAELKAVAFALPTNALSDVVETPHSYHILRVTAKPPTDVEDDEDEVEDDEGKPEKSICLWHIMFEKVKMLEPLDEKSARQFVYDEKVKTQVDAIKCAALSNTVIECAFSLNNKTRKRNKQ